MKEVQSIIRLLCRFWERWARVSPDAPDAPSIDPNEFSELIRSGRKQDLETLAKRLSERQRTRV
jgi:hypothetical protein